MKKRYESDILQMIHEEAEADFAVGAITEERMREYDRDCLVEEEEGETGMASRSSPAPAYAAPQ